MKIGVISDTHLNKFPDHLEKRIAKYFKDVDMIFHAGDVVELSVLDFFLDKEVKLVAGNMDSCEIKQISPIKLVIPIEGYKVGLIHGWGSPAGIEDRIIKEFDDIDILVYGHTHNASSFTKNGVLFFNPGSPTDKRFAVVNTIGILEIGEHISHQIITI
jgi:hypothetical protein